MDDVFAVLGVCLPFPMLGIFEGELMLSCSDSEERWKSEGVQVGGVNSGRGVFGHWFDKYVPFNFPQRFST